MNERLSSTKVHESVSESGVSIFVESQNCRVLDM